jgi:glycosyltransferase involved in cell wall biosynthesis
MSASVSTSAPPRVSVLMPTYNARGYIEAAVRSILNQTFTNFEYLILDDGSADGTARILDRLAREDARIRLTRRQNKGLTVSLNECVAQARGTYLARMDSDDVAAPERFAKQVAFLDAHADCVVVGSRIELIDPFDVSLDLPRHKLEHAEIDADLLAGLGWAIVHPAAMLRADAVRRVGVYRPEFNGSEDLDLFLRLAEVGRLANLPDVLLKYRQHLGSVNRTKFQKQIVLTNQVIAEARQRRKLPPAAPYTGQERQTLAPTPQHLLWGWRALKLGHARAARRHARAALRHTPWSVEALKLLACGVRGR